jgi:hypothetical protein
MEDAPPHPLIAPQTARYTLRAGDKFVLESEIRVTPLGLLAGGAVIWTRGLASAAMRRSRRCQPSRRAQGDGGDEQGPQGNRKRVVYGLGGRGARLT